MRLRELLSSALFVPPVGTTLFEFTSVSGLGVVAVAVQLLRFPDSKSSVKIFAATALNGEPMAASNVISRARIRVVCIDTGGILPSEKKRRRAADKIVRGR